MKVKALSNIKITKKRKNSENTQTPPVNSIITREEYLSECLLISPYRHGNFAIKVNHVNYFRIAEFINISVKCRTIGFWGFDSKNNILFPIQNRITYLTEMHPISYYWNRFPDFEKKKFNYQELKSTIGSYSYGILDLELNRKSVCKKFNNLSKFMFLYAMHRNLFQFIIKYQNYFYDYLCEINKSTFEGEIYTFFRTNFNSEIEVVPPFNIPFKNSFFFVRGIPWKQNDFLFYVALLVDSKNEFIPVICIRNFYAQTLIDLEIPKEFLATDEQDVFPWKFEDPRICYDELAKSGEMPNLSECSVEECFFEYKSFYKRTGLNPYCDQILDYLKNFAHSQFIKFFKQRSYLADLIYFYYKSKLQIQDVEFLSSNVDNNHFLPKIFKVENYGFCKIIFEHYKILNDVYRCYQINLNVAPFIKNGLCESMLILSIDNVDYKTIDKKIHLSENLDVGYVSKGHSYCFPSTKTTIYEPCSYMDVKNSYTEHGAGMWNIEKVLDFYISQNLKTEDLSIDNFFRYYLIKNPEKKKQVEEMKKMVKIYCDLVNQTKFNVLDDVGLFTRDPAMFEHVKEQVTLCRDSLNKFFIDFFGSLGLLNNFLNLKMIKIKWNRKHKMFSFYKK